MDFYPPVGGSAVRAMVPGDGVVLGDVPIFADLRCTWSALSQSSRDGAVLEWRRPMEIGRRGMWLVSSRLSRTALYLGSVVPQRSGGAVLGWHRPEDRDGIVLGSCSGYAQWLEGKLSKYAL